MGGTATRCRGAGEVPRRGHGGLRPSPHLLPPLSLGPLAPGPLPGRVRLAPASRQLAAEGRPRKTRPWFGARLRGHPDVRVGPEMPPGDSQAAGTQPPHRWGHAGPTPPTPCRDAQGAGVGCSGVPHNHPAACPAPWAPGVGWEGPKSPVLGAPVTRVLRARACHVRPRCVCSHLPCTRAQLGHRGGAPPNCGIRGVPHSCTHTPCTLLGAPPLPCTLMCTPRAWWRLSPLAHAHLGARWGLPPACCRPPLARFRPPLARSHAPGPPPPCKSPPSPSCAC